MLVALRDAVDEFGGVVLMSLGVGLEQELGDEFGSDFDELGEFGVHFLVRLREKGMC